MRYYLILIQVITVFVAFIQASSLFQATLLSNSVDHLQDEMLRDVEQLLQGDPDNSTKNCNSCINLLNVLKRLTMFPENVQISAMINICKRMNQVDNEVCEGVVREQGPVVRKVFRTMDMFGRDGHLLCASVINACPYPDVLPWKVPFPKEKPKNPFFHPPANKTMTVLHLSDWHIDPQYEEGAETRCDKPICCRKAYTREDSILQKASPWGSFGCDSPLSLIESMLEYIPQVAQNASFGILTGDIPPHEVWETLPTEKTQSIQDTSYSLLHAYFDSPFLINTKLFPSVGNHESAPTNLFPLFDSNLPNDERRADLTMDWLYTSLKESWRGWVSPKHLVGFHKRSGSYISYPTPGLKLISINTNFCYNLNWWLYEQPVRRDPNGILKWLIDQLQDAEDKHERVWIIGHTPPGDSSCFHDYANYYYQIVNRYAPHVIAGQFFGHTHRDEFQLFYKVGSQQASDAISISYLAPSITPFPDLNPGFRTYAVDMGNFEVVNSYTYIANLEESTTWQQEPRWYLEYSAREAYGSPNNSYKPLSPSWWHKVTQEMELDDDKFNAYWSYRYKSSSIMPVCDTVCRVNTICGMRAGKSELRCDYDPSSSTPRPVILNRKEQDACGISILKRNQQ